MRFTRIYASLAALTTAKPAGTFPGETVTVASVIPQTYTAFSNGVAWQAVTPVYIGARTLFPLPADVPANAEAIDTSVTPHRSYFIRNGAWYPAAPRKTKENPLDQLDAVYNGTTNITTQIQAAMDVPYSASLPAGFSYGKGATIATEAGVIKVSPLSMTAWSSIEGAGPVGSTVWVMDHTGIGSTNAMFTERLDAGAANQITSKPAFINAAFYGNSGAASQTVHGYIAPEVVSDTNDGPILINTIWSTFSGDGVRIDKRHNQVRVLNSQVVANTGWGLFARKSADLRALQLSSKDNLGGQVYIEDTASAQVTQFDLSTPSGGGFAGLYAAQVVASRNVRLYQGEVNGVVRIEGSNSSDTDPMQRQDSGIQMVGFNARISPETYQGVQYPGHTPTPGATLYEAPFQMRSANGVKFAFGQIGYTAGTADAPNLAATPKYVWNFSVPGGRDYATEAGWVEITGVNLIHLYGFPGTATKPQIPFTQHWSNDPARVLWTGTAPGCTVCLPTAAVPINMKLADGSSVVTADYPLCWLGLDFTRNWASKPTNFNLPDFRFQPAPTGHAWYTRMW